MSSVINFLCSLLDDVLVDELLVCWDSGFVDPAQVPGFHVIPPFLNFVVSGPHEGSVQVPVEGVESASSNLSNLGSVEKEGIAGAHAGNDQSGVCHAWITGTDRSNEGSPISAWSDLPGRQLEIGRASCRERVCQHV